jgi:hypothetical protein
MAQVTDSQIILYQEQIQKALSGYIVPLSVAPERSELTK